MDQTPNQAVPIAAAPETTVLVQLSPAGLALAGDGGNIRLITGTLDYTFTAGQSLPVKLADWHRGLVGYGNPAGDPLLQLSPAVANSNSTAAIANTATLINTAAATEEQPSHGV